MRLHQSVLMVAAVNGAALDSWVGFILSGSYE